MTIPVAMVLAAALNACGVGWDPVQVLPVEVRREVAGAKVITPCRVSALPEGIRDHLAETIGEKKLVMADPDKAWNSSCLQHEGVPSRQLVAAASSGSRWVVHYREGGEAVSEWAIVLELEARGVRTLWRGSCTERRRAAGSRRDALGKARRDCTAVLP